MILSSIFFCKLLKILDIKYYENKIKLPKYVCLLLYLYLFNLCNLIKFIVNYYYKVAFCL